MLIIFLLKNKAELSSLVPRPVSAWCRSLLEHHKGWTSRRVCVVHTVLNRVETRREGVDFSYDVKGESIGLGVTVSFGKCSMYVCL